MTDLTTTQWRRIAKAAIYLPQGRFVGLKQLREILGRQKTLNQIRTQMMWHKEAAEQLQDETAQEKRAWAKLNIGCAILCAENADFKEKYDLVIAPLPYVAKLALMIEPFDFEVTRVMTKQQKSQFLTELRKHYEDQGVELTIPDDFDEHKKRSAA